MLTVRNLHVRYGRSVAALHGIDLDVPDDGVLAVLGSNGAGKSTLLRTISGTLRLHRGTVSGGEVRYGERRIDRLDPAAIVGLGVVGVPEGRQIFARMSVDENLRAGGIGARSAEDRARARERVHELFPVLAERARQRAGLLSGGEQQMLAIGRALMAGPKLLLLDEPSLGLAPKIVERIAGIIREIHQQGTAVVLVEQNAVMALQVADQAVVLETGTVALAGSAAELSASEEVQRLYLGGHAESDTAAEEEAALARRQRVGARGLSRWTG
ncbi:amino acid/amide ABC transporter ATP-binding protein 2 (HAAT family) [Prauserella shujinwangii]|uniref:Amino acid/amide ABC transporter ATP-binding protein 2 (HAAT family) n=1 Tax=Prauserella shujinwangii TaxID=1453103 RepID=A0A2T0LNE2_9PSEU|nr:ABC transporter ATP-binding protein [Prauserella shujinwangii]PRX44717.1 amino acid/amide ABC transporter ATP-binding protein 2 (HAAT family) [Prauserella shujinwangii]